MNRSTEYFVIVNSDEDFTLEPKIIQQYDIQLTTGWEETSNGDFAKGKIKIAIQYIWRNQRDEFPIGTEMKDKNSGWPSHPLLVRSMYNHPYRHDKLQVRAEREQNHLFYTR